MKKILIVVDMQHDFIDGALGSPEAMAIVPNVAAKINEYEANGDAIIYTADTHFENYMETMEGEKLPVPHCIHATGGWHIPEDLYIANKPIVHKYSFGSINLHHYIDAVSGADEIESIEFVGLCTDICVISNVMIIKAYYPNTKIIVDSSCCAGVTPESHTRALEAMKMCHIEIV
jgi:nicotinamidase-related amidase